MAETPRTEAGRRALNRMCHPGGEPAHGEEPALDLILAIEAEAQDTAASSGLREAAEAIARPIAPGEGPYVYVRAEEVQALYAALAHSTPDAAAVYNAEQYDPLIGHASTPEPSLRELAQEVAKDWNGRVITGPDIVAAIKAVEPGYEPDTNVRWAEVAARLATGIVVPNSELRESTYPASLSAQPACGRCGGPHQFDTSIASPLWNRVIRDAGLPDYLCTTCIVWAFVRAGESFEAELYGGAVNVAEGVPTISVQVGSRPIDQSYGDLQAQLRTLSAQPSEPGEAP